MEENLDSPQQDGQPNAELGPAEPRYQEEAQPAENSSSQYGWLQMRGQGYPFKVSRSYGYDTCAGPMQ